jgi:hypothetical protein
MRIIKYCSMGLEMISHMAKCYDRQIIKFFDILNFSLPIHTKHVVILETNQEIEMSKLMGWGCNV